MVARRSGLDAIREQYVRDAIRVSFGLLEFQNCWVVYEAGLSVPRLQLGPNPGDRKIAPAASARFLQNLGNRMKRQFTAKFAKGAKGCEGRNNARKTGKRVRQRAFWVCFAPSSFLRTFEVRTLCNSFGSCCDLAFALVCLRVSCRLTHAILGESNRRDLKFQALTLWKKRSIGVLAH